MTKRYETRNTTWTLDPGLPFHFTESAHGQTITVHEPESRTMPTGLFDHRGNQIVATINVEPIGFVKIE